ncbi:unnamed protein product [Discula destructiva]
MAPHRTKKQEAEPRHGMPSTSIEQCQDLLKSSNRILALCGAGLSAASGLPTFRGAGGLWRNHESTSLATPDAFRKDPALVWLFYAWRRHMALQAKPNAGHVALAQFSKKKDNFLCLTQNVDGLSIRADHPKDKLRLLHGSILDIKCFDKDCGYIEVDNLKDPLCPALQAASAVNTPADQGLPLLDPSQPVPEIDVKELPHCPKCSQALLRPGVVWFNERLDDKMLDEVDKWIWEGGPIDLVLVVGTSAQVYPAAGYTAKAKGMSARVAVINPDPDSAKDLGKGDFFFEGDAAQILPQLTAKITGEP